MLAIWEPMDPLLEKAGLVTISMRGRERVYHLDAGRLRSVTGAWIDRFGA